MVKDAGWRALAPMMIVAGAGTMASPVRAAEPVPVRVVRYAPAPGWAIAPPKGSDAPTPPGAPLRVVFVDQQVRVTDHGQEEFDTTRMAVLTPDALAAGNLAVTWAPANEEIIVHRLAIIRDGKTIDVLATQKFAVIERENNLEQAALDGDLTATLQVAGLQVGDELALALTKVRHDTSLRERPQGFMQLQQLGVRGAYRVRLLDPRNSGVRYRASADLPEPVVRQIGSETERTLMLTDPASVTIPYGAPPRYSIARLVQFSGYADWAAVSRTFDVPFMHAGILGADSPVKAEAARIAAETTDPVRRAEAALRLVQDRIRYVYVGLNGGNYRPADVDETWRRRFGDCKAKTVLLIALLHEMGIAAEPVLVASKGGDGIDERLPTPTVFDHVVVRATIDAAPVWLDGTRIGDRTLAGLPPPDSRFGLPLRIEGAPLEFIPPQPPRLPERVQVVEIDASAGFDKPGRYRVQQTLRGNEILAVRGQLAGLAPADADKALRVYWHQQFANIEPSSVTWRFDDANRLLVLGVVGDGKVDWDGDATQGHTHYLFGAGFPPPDDMKRPKDQPQDVPWANDYPAFTCYATTVKVPVAGKGFHWSFSSGPMDRVLGGISYWRISSFDGTTARMVKSRRVNMPEISARDAAAVKMVEPKFDNDKSYVWEIPKESTGEVGVDTASHFGTFEEFAGPTPPCQSPSRAATIDKVTIKTLPSASPH